MPAFSTLLSATAAAVTFLAAGPGAVRAQGPDGNPWTGVGSASFYWHNRYHGCLAMAVYGDYESLCPRQFTYESLQHQYPGNQNQPFEVVGTFGPTPNYGLTGFMVRIAEMNKILMVFRGAFGWQNFNATLSPFRGVGCDSTCMAHTGALEAWAEVKAETNDMEVIKRRQGDLVWSAAGHGFGGMVMQVAALDLKSRGFLFSAHSFGSAPVFNQAAARRWDDLFEGDASQRTVANEDSIPAAIPFNGKYLANGTVSDSEYAFVGTGIHVYGSGNPMYGQHFDVCVDNPRDARCAGGNNEADHYFYYTEIGTCCGNGYDAAYRPAENSRMLASEQRAYNATGTAPVLSAPVTAIPAPSTTAMPNTTALASTDALANATSVLEGNATATPAATATAGVGALGANGQQAGSTQAVEGAASRLVVPGVAAVIAAVVAAVAL